MLSLFETESIKSALLDLRKSVRTTMAAIEELEAVYDYTQGKNPPTPGEFNLVNLAREILMTKR